MMAHIFNYLSIVVVVWPNLERHYIAWISAWLLLKLLGAWCMSVSVWVQVHYSTDRPPDKFFHRYICFCKRKFSEVCIAHSWAIFFQWKFKLAHITHTPMFLTSLETYTKPITRQSKLLILNNHLWIEHIQSTQLIVMKKVVISHVYYPCENFEWMGDRACGVNELDLLQLSQLDWV